MERGYLVAADQYNQLPIARTVVPQQQDHVSKNDRASSSSVSNVVQNGKTSFFTSFYNLVHHSSTRFALTLRASSTNLFPGMPSIGRFIHQLCTAALRIVNPTALANADWEHASSMHARAQQLKDEAEQTQKEGAFTETASSDAAVSAAWTQALET